MRSVGSERLRMMEGCEVEISYNKNGGVWYKAIIDSKPPTKPKSRVRERCVRLLKDDFSTPLTKLTHDVSFRLISPKHFEACIDIKQGSIVDADHKDGWWTGLVVKEIEDDRCLVFFDSPPDIIQFERKNLRPQPDWVDESLWVIRGRYIQLTNEPMFSPGAMVEVRSKINVSELVWLPAMIVKEIEEDDEKKYIVKFCVDYLSCNGNKRRPNKSVDLGSVRPRPPPFCVEDYEVGEYVEVFHGTEWRQGRVIRRLSPGWYNMVLEATKKELGFKHSDLRPLKVWEDGVWKSKESPLTQRSRKKMGDSVMNAKEYGSHVTTSPGITATPLKQTEPGTQSKTLPRNQNVSGNNSTQQNENNEDNNRKRKREQNLSSDAITEDNKAKDTTMVLPFEKKLPIWRTVESMEVFKTVPQSPHFSPLVETSKDSREVSAVGMMLTFSGLLDEVKDLQHNDPMSSLISLNDSFAELEKHGFDIKVPQSRIIKLLSLRDMKAKKMEELKDVKKVIAEKESLKVENERKILELQRLNEEMNKEIAQSKSFAGSIVHQLEDVKLQFQTTASASW